MDRQAKRCLHRALDCADTHLPVTLGGMCIPTGEQSTVTPDRQVQGRSHDEVAVVDVASPLVGREGKVLTGLVRVDSHSPQERLDRDLDPGNERCRLAAAEVEDPKVRIREVVRQEAEFRDDGCPPPVPRLECEHIDLQRVARLCTLHCDRARQVVDGVEVPSDVLDGGRFLDLSLAGDQEVEVHDVA